MICMFASIPAMGTQLLFCSCYVCLTYFLLTTDEDVVIKLGGTKKNYMITLASNEILAVPKYKQKQKYMRKGTKRTDT